MLQRFSSISATAPASHENQSHLLALSLAYVSPAEADESVQRKRLSGMRSEKQSCQEARFPEQADPYQTLRTLSGLSHSDASLPFAVPLYPGSN